MCYCAPQTALEAAVADGVLWKEALVGRHRARTFIPQSPLISLSSQYAQPDSGTSVLGKNCYTEGSTTDIGHAAI
jgi:hypothetical protein